MQELGRGRAVPSSCPFRTRFICYFPSLLSESLEQCFAAIFMTPFFTPFFLSQVKQQENEVALLLLSNRLKELDALPWEQRQRALIEGIVAGNVFDWGAKEVAK